MASPGSRFQYVKKFGLALGPALFFATILITPINDTLSFGAIVVLATTLWMATWWITEVIPIYATALLPLGIFPIFGVSTVGDTSANYADPIVFLFLGGFLIAKAIEKSGLHRRFALTMLRVFGTKPKNIVAAFMTATGFVSAWISNTATTLLMLPIAVAVITQTSNSPLLNSRKKEMFATCIMLSIAYSASLGGIATLLGTPPNAIFASLAQSLSGVEVTFTQWMFVAAPISAVSLFVVWWYLTNFGAKVKDIPPLIEGKDGVASELAKLGRMTRNEKAVMAVFAATATAWISRGLVWKDALPMVDDITIAIVAAISLFIIRFPLVKKQSKSEIVKGYEFEEADHNNDTGALLDWRTAVKIPWGVLLLIGGGLALANAFATTQLDDWIAGQLRFLDGAPLIIIILAIVTVTVFTGVIISNTATAALFIPVTASLADSLGVSPVYFMVPVAIAASYCFILPAGTPPNAIVFSTGHVTAGRMARAGIVAALVGVGIVTVLTSILVPLVWG